MVAGGSEENVQPQSEGMLECNQEANEQRSNGDRATCAFQLPALQQHQAASLVAGCIHNGMVRTSSDRTRNGHATGTLLAPRVHGLQ
jgi:hypothetical protein